VDSNAVSYSKNDAGVCSIVSPFEELCSTSFTPVVYLQNKGVNNLTSAIIHYQVDNGTINTYNWSGNLIQLGKAKVTLPSQSVSAGGHTFKAYTTMPNGVADLVPSNDGMTENFNSITHGTTSIAEGFEGAFPPTGWRQSGSDSAWGWKRSIHGRCPAFLELPRNPTGAYGQSNSCIYFDNEVPDNTGKHYSIRTPQCDFANVSSPVLTYDYAYSPSSSSSGSGTDTLVVYYSQDCGSTWKTLLKKGGLALSTTGGFTSGDTLPFVPTTAQWKKETIDLTALIGQSEVMFSFENRFQWGHMLYLDNIGVTSVTGIVNEKQESISLNVYPNPTNGIFTIECGETKNELIIYNVLGEKIYQSQINQLNNLPTGQAGSTIDLSNQPNGIYFLQVKTEKGIVDKKIVISH
jgi:hypothetical protein